MIEYLKTTVLTLLILLSIFLTYQIWTFQPDYAILKSSEYIENTPIGEEKRLSEVILPKHVVVHNNEISVSPLDKVGFSNKFFEEHRGFSFQKQTQSNNLTYFYSDFEDYIGLEFIFPASVPIEVLKELLQLTNIQLLSINLIDKLIFFVNNDVEKEIISVKLISLEEQISVTVETNLSVSKFKENIQIEESERFYEVFPIEIINFRNGFKKIVYLPTESLLINSVTYLTKSISPDHFKQTLFSDPNFVKHYMQSNGKESFTDGNRMVNIFDNGTILKYINPTFGDITERNSKHILLSAVEFLNGHGGLTSLFYYDSLSSIGLNEEITFRLMVEGIPVYQSNYGVNHLFEITLNRMNGNQFSEYIRPLVYIEDDPIYITETKKLPSGYNLIETLNQKDDFNRFLLTDINIGYTMIKRQSFIIFEPRWFIQYNGNWEVVNVINEVEDSEGYVYGLE